MRMAVRKLVMCQINETVYNYSYKKEKFEVMSIFVSCQLH